MLHTIFTPWNVNGEDREVTVQFQVTSYYAGRDSDQYCPAEEPEYEFEITDVQYDPNEEPVPENIREEIEEWFYSEDTLIECIEIVEYDREFQE